MEIHIIKRSLLRQYIDMYNLFFNCIQCTQEIHKGAINSQKPKGVENTVSLVRKEQRITRIPVPLSPRKPSVVREEGQFIHSGPWCNEVETATASYRKPIGDPAKRMSVFDILCSKKSTCRICPKEMRDANKFIYQNVHCTITYSTKRLETV